VGRAWLVRARLVLVRLVLVRLLLVRLVLVPVPPPVARQQVSAASAEAWQ
jgi:hypothetical protein